MLSREEPEPGSTTKLWGLLAGSRLTDDQGIAHSATFQFGPTNKVDEAHNVLRARRLLYNDLQGKRPKISMTAPYSKGNLISPSCGSSSRPCEGLGEDGSRPLRRNSRGNRSAERGAARLCEVPPRQWVRVAYGGDNLRTRQ